MNHKINDEYNMIKKPTDYHTTYLNNCKLNNVCPRSDSLLRKSKSNETLKGIYGKTIVNTMLESYKMMPVED